MATYPDLRQKTFIVTGAASGMGREISLALGRQGANVALFDLNSSERVVAEIKNQGGNAIPFTCDVAKFDQVDKCVKAVTSHFGALHGAANMAGYVGNQGFHGKGYAVDILKDEDWRSLLDVNLEGVRNCLKAQLNSVENGGSIVNAASISSIFGPPYNAPYAVAKAGVVQLTKCAAQENGLRNIRINAVAPGAVETPLLASLGDVKEATERLAVKTALKRVAQPQEVAKVVVFLLSNEASYISATLVNVDAGFDPLAG